MEIITFFALSYNSENEKDKLELIRTFFKQILLDIKNATLQTSVSIVLYFNF